MEDNLEKYDGVNGVWAIRGKIIGKNVWRWFNVAKTQDIKDEVDKDIHFMAENFSNPLVECEYVTKWNKHFGYKDFKYPRRRVYVWNLIGNIVRNECNEVEILCVAKDLDEKDLGMVEQFFAFYTQAEFWSDRMHYEVDDDEIQKRIERYLEDNDVKDYFKDKKFETIYKESLDDISKRIF